MLVVEWFFSPYNVNENTLKNVWCAPWERPTSHHERLSHCLENPLFRSPVIPCIRLSHVKFPPSGVVSLNYWSKWHFPQYSQCPCLRQSGVIYCVKYSGWLSKQQGGNRYSTHRCSERRIPPHSVVMLFVYNNDPRGECWLPWAM